MDHPRLSASMHGGRMLEARRLFPSAPEPFIDLSTGINPLPYPVPPIERAAWTRLPEPEDIAALENVAAKAYGVSNASMVAALPGTQALISLLPRLFPQTSVAILSPTYGEYSQAFAAAGSRVVEASTLAELKSASCVVICNPNNPDGRRFDAGALLSLCRNRKARGLFMVDESFIDLEDDGLTLAPHMPQPGLLVLRSISKSYGLAGLRLGFALANPDLGRSIRAALGPWPVSGSAIKIGIKAISDRLWLAAAKQRLFNDVARLDGMLRKAGLTIVGGTLLFRLVESTEARDLFHRLGEAGILVRGFAYHPGWLRLGLPGSEDAWRRLDAALSIKPGSNHSD